MASLKFQQGKITLPGGIATLDLPATFRYLDPADSARILVDAWGNPPGSKTLGMIFPADISPLAENGWGVVITYDEEGHIKDRYRARQRGEAASSGLPNQGRTHERDRIQG